MVPQPITGVGDIAAQARFLERYKPFLDEYPELISLLKKVFLRTLTYPPDEEFKAIEGLADDDPRVIAFEDKVLANKVIFYLGRIAADDFVELIVLAGNGLGVGACKILRGMYERVVTGAFIAKNPAESRRFMEEESIQKWKIWQSALKVMPEIKDKYTEEQINGLEEACNAAKARKNESFCKKCNQPITAEAWTRVDLATMARKSDPNLAALYVAAYLIPTFHSHATGFGISRRLRRADDGGGWTFREITEEEVRSALQLAHNLILRVLALHNEYFQLGYSTESAARAKAFLEIWDRIK
jgi:hypothetical protein